MRAAPGSSLAWHRKHGRHVTGFCDWVCLPSELVNDLADKAKQTEDEVIAWALGVREAWRGPVDEPDCFRFWRDRYRDDMRRPQAAARAVPAEPVPIRGWRPTASVVQEIAAASGRDPRVVAEQLVAEVEAGGDPHEVCASARKAVAS